MLSLSVSQHDVSWKNLVCNSQYIDEARFVTDYLNPADIPFLMMVRTTLQCRPK